MPVTFPRTLGQVPIYYNMKRAGRLNHNDNPKERYTSNYLDPKNSPLYAFGHGLNNKLVESYSVTSLHKKEAKEHNSLASFLMLYIKCLS